MLLTPILSALKLIIGYFFSIFTYMVLVRLLAQLVRADFHNPLLQFVVRATNPLLIPLRRIIPSIGKFDTASIVLALLLILVEILLLRTLYEGSLPLDLLLAPEIYVILITKLLSMIIKLLIYITVILSLLSWIQLNQHNPLLILLNQITEPMLRPIRRLMPASGLDFSPMILIIILYIIDEVAAGYLRILLEALN